MHLHDAGLYDGGTGITQGALFRVEACVAVVVALALLVRPHWVVWAVALLVAAGAAGAIYLYTYVDVLARRRTVPLARGPGEFTGDSRMRRAACPSNADSAQHP